jgi:hypothetical protein
VIITDFRYTEAAEKQAPDFEVIMTDSDHPHEKRLAELCEQDRIAELRFESNYLPVDDFEEYAAFSMATPSVFNNPCLLRFLE